MRLPLGHFVHDDNGQDLVEYVFLMTFIALVCIIAMQNLGASVNNTFDKASTRISTGS